MSDALINEVLSEYGSETRALIDKTLPDREPRRFLYEPVADYPRRGGKMLRSSLCIAAARCFGARHDIAVALAAGIELLHNALLIHDDIEDESENRRGAAALHKIHGIPIALNAGDMLAFLSFRPFQAILPQIGPILGQALFAEFDRVAQETAEGQALELGWRRENTAHLSGSDYLEMVLKKTCWLATILPCRIGATLGARRRLDPAAFVRFGFFAGAAFQIQDDLMNIEYHAQYGKELCGDLYEGKRTLMLIDLLQVMSAEDRRRVLYFLGLPRNKRTEKDVTWIRQRMEEEGCIARATMVAEAMVGAANVEFEKAFASAPESRDKAFIRSVSVWLLSPTQ